MNLITRLKREWKNLTTKNSTDKALRLTYLATPIEVIEKLASRHLHNEGTPSPSIWTRVVLGSHSRAEGAFDMERPSDTRWCNNRLVPL
jgi:hypothetical protein